jgi:hypothetical protein
MIALDVRTGRIVWQTFALPDNGGQPGGFAGGAFLNPPAIDVENGLVFGAAGQLFTQPATVTACLAAAQGGWDEACFPPNAWVVPRYRTGRAAPWLWQRSAAVVSAVGRQLQRVGLCKIRRERFPRTHRRTLA